MADRQTYIGIYLDHNNERKTATGVFSNEDQAEKAFKDRHDCKKLIATAPQQYQGGRRG